MAAGAGAIVGREDELALLRELVTTTAAWPRALVLEGEAGAGKTTLWQSAVDGAAGRVLTTRPLETETKLAYAGVGDLLESVQDRLAELPAPQAHALRAALLLESPDAGVVDERAVALGFLGLLVAEAPVLLAVDDLQWLDRQSARVLAFAAHRVGEVPVAFLVGTPVPDADLDALCREHLVPYKVPAAYHWIAELPRSEVGKLLRRDLTDSLRN